MKSLRAFVIFGIYLFLTTSVVLGINETNGRMIEDGSITKKMIEHDQHIIELWQDKEDPYKLELKLFTNSYNVSIDLPPNSVSLK
uniref:Uncharacterized protein n=1 Tax=Panagrolaimus davidi TaxID=227884 RepID=A0A914PFY7_9BILA